MVAFVVLKHLKDEKIPLKMNGGTILIDANAKGEIREYVSNPSHTYADLWSNKVNDPIPKMNNMGDRVFCC